MLPGCTNIRSMADAFELGPAVAVEAESVGVPGQRRFRLRAMNDTSIIATVWLEKEQLIAVGEAIESTLKEEGYRHRPRSLDQDQPAVLPLSLGNEIRALQLSLGLNRESSSIVLIGSDGPAGDGDTSTISFEVDYYLAHLLREQITSVVSAGRPLCPLCTAPMDPAGHVCVRTNGHHPH